MKIIGIDPGYDRVGIAIIEKNSPKEKEVLVHSECFTTVKADHIYDRLKEVGLRIRTLITEHQPKMLAMETLFITKNQKTAMHVAEARGIIAYEARLAGIPIFEYTPPQIKVAITGDGHSDKSQIIKMVPLLIKMSEKKRIDDEYDAIAIALTCAACEAKVFHNP